MEFLKSFQEAKNSTIEETLVKSKVRQTHLMLLLLIFN